MEKEWGIDTCSKLDEFCKSYAEIKKPAQNIKLYDSIYITLLIWQNYRSGEQISGWQGLENSRGQGRGDKKEIWGVFVVDAWTKHGIKLHNIKCTDTQKWAGGATEKVWE